MNISMDSKGADMINNEMTFDLDGSLIWPVPSGPEREEEVRTVAEKRSFLGLFRR